MIFAVIVVFSLTGKARVSFFTLKMRPSLLLFMWKSFDLRGNKKNYFFHLGVDPTLLSHFENSPRVTWKWNFLINHLIELLSLLKQLLCFLGKPPIDDFRTVAHVKTLVHQLYSAMNIEEHQVYVSVTVCK